MQHDAMRMQLRRLWGDLELATAWLELDGLVSKEALIVRMRNGTWRFRPVWQSISGEHNVSVLAWAAMREAEKLQNNGLLSGTRAMSRRTVSNAKQLLVAAMVTGQARGEA